MTILASIIGVSFAQTAQTSFEVASIRPSSPGDGQSAIYFRPGGFIAENATATELMAYAYNAKDFQISGGPGWLDSDKFNITAKYEDSVDEGRPRLSWTQYREQLGRTVQLLLEDRLKLRVTHQRRESPILALVTAKGGPKLSRSVLDTHEADIRGRRGQLIAKGLSVAQLADILSWTPEVDGRKVGTKPASRAPLIFRYAGPSSERRLRSRPISGRRCSPQYRGAARHVRALNFRCASTATWPEA